MRNRQPRSKWTSEEEAALRAGVLKHGIGWWKEILRDSEFNPILSNRSNIALKDKWRNLSAAGNQGRCRKKLRVRKPKVANSDGLSPAAAQLPTEQTSIASAPVARKVDDSPKGLLDINNISLFDEKIFEAFSTLKEQIVWDTNTIASYIEKRHEVPKNFRNILSTRLRKLFQHDKHDKLEKSIGHVKSSNPVEEAAVAPAYRIVPWRPDFINYIDKTNFRWCGKYDDDYINKLPDEILVLILCFVSTKEAIRTSLVSRRWKNLWMKVPKLEFCSWGCKELNGYVNLVNQVVKLHDTTSTLEELTIRFPLKSNYSDDINTWVEFAARKQVKKLELDFCKKSLPGTSWSYGNFLASTVAIGLYWLKDLYLKSINIDDKVFECLLSNSPFIERLSVIDSQDLSNVVVANAPNLKYLELSHCHSLFHLDISAPNLNIFKLHLYRNLVSANISAPLLSRLSISFYHAPRVSCFDKALYSIHDILDCLQNLLGQLSHVNQKVSLTVSREVWFRNCIMIDISHWLPGLSNVEHLKITIRKPFLLWHIYVDKPYQWVHGHLWPCAMVKRAPFLHKLSIKLFHVDHMLHRSNINAKWMDEDVLDKVKALANVNGHYSHQHLKEVELVGFTGCVDEVELVLYLVEIAASLEKIIIHLCKLDCKWIDVDIAWYKENDYDKFCQQCAEVLKTLIRPEIDIEIF